MVKLISPNSWSLTIVTGCGNEVTVAAAKLDSFMITMKTIIPQPLLATKAILKEAIW